MDEEAEAQQQERLYIASGRKSISREERVIFGFIIGCGGLAVVLGALYIVSNMNKPFLITYSGERYMDSDDVQNAERQKQRKEDTDSDGISDYDELYVFKTSPYIQDSDDDGLHDGIEIQSGSDPNCAPDKPCAQANTVQNADAVTVDSTSGSFLDIEAPTAPDQQPTSAAEVVSALQHLSAAEIRDLLRESGLSEEDLAQIPDDMLVTLYTQALSQAAAETSGAEVEEETVPTE